MRRAPIRIRTFILGTVLVLLVVPSLAGGAAWLIESHRQQQRIDRRLSAAVAYLASHRMQEPASVQGFARLLDRLDLLAQLASVGPSGKNRLFVSPALAQGQAPPESTAAIKADQLPSSMADDRELIPTGSGTVLLTDLYYQPASRATPALVALVTGIIVLLAGLAIALWLAGRWMVSPLTRLSAQVDKVAGGDLTIAVPHSRIGEIANIAQAVDGMTAALGETAQRRAEADEARRFLVTSVAHDLRTPLFALRGHLQAIGSRLGDPDVHLQRAKARADALERLIGNLFAYTRDDYTRPALQLAPVLVTDLLEDVTTGLEHAARLRGNRFELDGDPATRVIVDRDRVKRALTNVLDNALHYSPVGAPVDVAWAAADESTVEITIRDYGPGIDPDILPHVFEPGIRGSPAPGVPADGAGLGLTIAKRLLEHQHGTVTAYTQQTGGAVIRLVLQRALQVTRQRPESSVRRPSA